MNEKYLWELWRKCNHPHPKWGGDSMVWPMEFAELIIKECISVLIEQADDIDNGNIFNDQELVNKFEERWSAGIYYSVDKIKEHFGMNNETE